MTSYVVNSTFINYKQFPKIVKRTARRNISGKCYTNYIPGLIPPVCRIYLTYKHLYEIDPFSAKTIAVGEEVPYILAYRSHHRIGRTISFVLKKLNLALTRT